MDNVADGKVSQWLSSHCWDQGDLDLGFTASLRHKLESTDSTWLGTSMSLLLYRRIISISLPPISSYYTDKGSVNTVLTQYLLTLKKV